MLYMEFEDKLMELGFYLTTTTWYCPTHDKDLEYIHIFYAGDEKHVEVGGLSTDFEHHMNLYINELGLDISEFTVERLFSLMAEMTDTPLNERYRRT